MKAVLIDSVKGEVKSVEWNEIEDINKLIGCELFTVAITFENGVFLLVDDEGYLNGTKNFFKFKNNGGEMDWLAGNGLMIKEDPKTGQYGDVEFDIGLIERDTVFMGCDNEESCPVPSPIKVYSFL